jgi:hypothetical protein
MAVAVPMMISAKRAFVEKHVQIRFSVSAFPRWQLWHDFYSQAGRE